MLSKIMKAKDQTISDGCKTLLNEIYTHILLNSLLMVGIATLTIGFGFTDFIINNSFLFWTLIIAQFAIIIFQGRSSVYLYYLFGILEGILISVVFKYYNLEVILTAGIQTIGLFILMSAIGRFTSINFLKIKHILFFALLGLVLFALLSLFISGLSIWVSIIVLILFPILIISDTQQVIDDF